MDASFFISYARQDVAYVSRLAEHLQGFGLPLWFDLHMAWGSRYPEEIRLRLSEALGIIVVMSPGADASEWVEREILEGQRNDRDFLPILLAGERLFLLASSHYFDARDGALPGEREIRQLRAICDARTTGVEAGPALVLRPPVQPPPPPPVRPSPDRALLKLTSCLEEGQVEHADILTTSLLLEAVGRLGSGWMRRADGKRLPVALLDRIDLAWSTFSQGAMGFRAQLHKCPSPPPGAPAGSQRDFSLLALSLGWKAERRDTTPRYGEFVRPVGHPPGFFPTLRNPQLERHVSWHDQWVETVMAVHVRLRTWGGHA
ncbi:toll/interleukin-1 receptor domain-containing protein [Streptomyces sp. NPDC046931]|uniref:toll/interleukin-1 receptor domain-containing protein n=1 Tax=Streptomyces sp. NPDC046931 TaxID=3154806 RepID=UPI003402C8F9